MFGYYDKCLTTNNIPWLPEAFHARFPVSAEEVSAAGQRSFLSHAVNKPLVPRVQIIFCSCVNESRLFSFLRSLLREKWQIASLPENIEKTNLVIEWLNNYWIRLSQNSVICQCLQDQNEQAISEFPWASVSKRGLSLWYGNDFSFSRKITHCHKKGCALGLILKVMVFETRRWPIFCLSLRLGK